MTVLRKIKTEDNVLVFKTFICKLLAKRYSGEMDTSLCNSVANLIIMCFLLNMAGHEPVFYEEQFPPKVEGDDSIGAYIYELDPNILKNIGANAKLETFETYSEASFCGVCFGSSDGSIVKDPIKVLLDFGYTNYVYLGCSSLTRSKLIRAKSLSLLYSYPGCPILKSLANFGLRITSHVDNRHALYKRLKTATDSYDVLHWTTLLNVDFKALLNVPIQLDSRILVETKFKVLIEHQVAIELHLDSKKDLTPIDLPLICSLAGPGRSQHYDKYVRQLDLKSVKHNDREQSFQFK